MIDTKANYRLIRAWSVLICLNVLLALFLIVVILTIDEARRRPYYVFSFINASFCIAAVISRNKLIKHTKHVDEFNKHTGGDSDARN